MVLRPGKILCGVALCAAIVAGGRGRATAAATTDPAGMVPRIDLAPDLSVRPIGDGVFVVVHACPWPANAVLVEMADGTLVLAGSTYTPAAAQTVLTWIETRFGHRRIVAIDTGYHVDNLGGNQALLDAGIPVYGSDLTVRLLRERGEFMRQVTLKLIGAADSPASQLHAALKFAPPDHVFPLRDGLTLTFGGERVQMYYPGSSQAPDKVVVYFPARRLLFGSCMILSGDRPGNTADADLARWPESVRKLKQFPVDVVVPGHGDRLDPELIQHTIDVLTAR
jgi:glyoxylase-like metal-dependent hydrolase (beta-lactamase superfamily II)